MKEQLISFSTAKLAKEKGCIIKSDKSYNSIGNLESHRSINYYAPTQSLLQKWLREVHKIYVVPCPKYHSIVMCDVYHFTEVNKSGYTTIEGIKENTWEDALEKGLQEALKLI